MLLLVSGGAGSGKSEYAEGLLLHAAAGRRIYLATMQGEGEEAQARIVRHRALRTGKGFETLECPCELERLRIPAGSAVLLECLSNLCANECFGARGFAGVEQRLLSALLGLEAQCECLIVVTNELFSDGERYGAETERYLSVLAGLNRALAERAALVCELVCGLPIVWKGAAQ